MKQILQRLPNKVAAHKRVEEFKKKEQAMMERRIQQNVRIQTAVARDVIIKREIPLMSTPKDKLPEIADVIARERQERRHAAKKSSM